MKLCRVLVGAVALALVPCVASAAHPLYTVTMNGASESPPNGSSGSGSLAVQYDDVAHTLYIVGSFASLQGTTTAAHVHCCTASPHTGTASVATVSPAFAGFPFGVTSGSINVTLDLTQASSWDASFVTANGGTPAGAEAALAAGMAAETSYFDIHTTSFPGGEIRGFLIYSSPVELQSFDAE